MADVLQASSRSGNLRRDTQDSSDTVKPIHFQQNVLKPHFESEPISSSGQYVPFPSLNHLNINEPPPLSEQTSVSLSRLSASRSHLDTPAARTGPPRSLSFAHGLPGSPTGSISISNTYDRAISDGIPVEDNEFNSVDGLNFRGPLENLSPEDRQLGKGKKRERDTGWRSRDDSWNRRTRIDESSKEFVGPSVSAENDNKTNVDSNILRPKTMPLQKGDPSEHTLLRPEPIVTTASDIHSAGQQSLMRRAFSLPYRIQDEKDQKKGSETSTSRAKWARLRALLPQITHPHRSILPGPSVITSQAVNITDELITGGLSTLMLKLWFERDEKGHRRVPILLHRLRIRVSDSLHPLYGHKSVFRIECEYANGAAKWVAYRQLRDFLSLHAHYRVSNVYSRNVHKMPEFPTTSAFFPRYFFLVLVPTHASVTRRFALFQFFKERREGKRR
jgi:phospholipase D1/2